MNEPDGVCIPKQVAAPHAGEMDGKQTLACICFPGFSSMTSMDAFLSHDLKLTADT